MTRDPRVDPRPGDVTCTPDGAYERTVVAVEGDSVRWSFLGVDTWASLYRWHMLNATATIVKTAEGGT